jgi:fucose permease
MLAKFKTHKHIKYFFLYSISFLIYGACISGLGPFIPYLSASTGIVETEYSYLFSCRSFGMLAGALLCKLLQKKKLYNHTIMIVGTLSILIFSALFTYTTDSMWLGVWLFLVGTGYSILEVMLNVCILMINNPEEIEFWMLLTHGLFGVGGLLGPIIVFFF